MTAERPSAGVLAGLAALAFIVAFAAAAVLRPDSAPTRAPDVTLTSPTSSREGPAVAGVAVPGMSRVAPVPGLRLPVHKPKHHHAPAARPAEPVVAAPVATPRPTATAAPVVTAPPVVHSAPPAQPSTPNVGQAFDSSG